MDKENRRMSLSIKQLEKNPWEAIDEQFKVGQKIKGNISNITDFGIFVQLLPGIDGLVHISDLSWTEHIRSSKLICTKVVKKLKLLSCRSIKLIRKSRLVLNNFNKIHGNY